MSQLSSDAAFLLNVLERFLHDELQLPKVWATFVETYIELGKPSRPEERAWFEPIYEKLDFWVGEDPSEEDRAYGWIGVPEYKEWLRGYMQEFPNDLRSAARAQGEDESSDASK